MNLQQGANQILNSVAIGMRIGPHYDKKIEDYKVEKEKELADYKQSIIDKKEAKAAAEKQATLDEIQRRGEALTEEGNKALDEAENFIGPKRPETLEAEADTFKAIGKDIAGYAEDRMRLNPTEVNIAKAIRAKETAMKNAKYASDLKKFHKEQMKAIMEAEKDGKK